MNMRFSGLASKAEFYARNCHRSTNHMYDDKPYEHHLEAVVSNVKSFAGLLDPDQLELAEAGAWVHDTIEDTRQTFNDVASNVHPAVAELAYALTQEKGRNRRERESPSYFAGIRAAGRVAILVKLCDRLANAENAAATGHSMFGKYKKDMPEFLDALYCEESSDMTEVFARLAATVGAEWSPKVGA